jgi:hypothetical protein
LISIAIDATEADATCDDACSTASIASELLSSIEEESGQATVERETAIAASKGTSLIDPVKRIIGFS